MVVIVVMGVCGSGKQEDIRVEETKSHLEVTFDWHIIRESSDREIPPKGHCMKVMKKLTGWAIEMVLENIVHRTTVAEALASELHCTFRDADEFHSDENKHKMSNGLPLTDEDRMPWLLAIHKYIRGLLDSRDTGIVTCSSLKLWYRQILITGEVNQEHQTGQSALQRDILFVHLKGSAELIKDRLKQRSGHFMPAKLLQSQLDTLEEPNETENHITLDIEKSVEEIVIDVIRYLS